MKHGKRVAAAIILATVVSVGWGAAHLYLKSRLNQLLLKMERETPGLKMTYASTSLRPLSMRIALNDVSVTNKEQQFSYHVDQMLYGRCDLAHEIPRRCDMEWQGVTISSPSIKPFLSKMKALFGIPFKFDMKTAQFYQPEKNHAMRLDTSFSETNKFLARVKVAVSGVDIEELSHQAKLSYPDPKAKPDSTLSLAFSALSQIGNLRIQQIVLDLESAPLFSEAVAQLLNLKMAEVESDHPSVDELKTPVGREKALKVLRESTKGVQLALTLEATKELREFILVPRSVSVKLEPPVSKTIGGLVAEQPVGMNGWIQALGIQLRLNGKEVKLEDLSQLSGMAFTQTGANNPR